MQPKKKVMIKVIANCVPICMGGGRGGVGGHYRIIGRLLSLPQPQPTSCRQFGSQRLDDENDVNDTVVSPPHSVSNLRLVRYGSRRSADGKEEEKEETPAERQLRSRRMSIQLWNHSYWLKNNMDFQTQKKLFIENELKTSSSATTTTVPNISGGNVGQQQEFKSGVSYDELASFYKTFLDSNHRKHMNYNLEWYKMHTSLLWPEFKVSLIRLWRQLSAKF
ncbi:COA8 family protein CBG23705, mitochondrial-like [Oppia nitens]|uniref:COA8 family protein CBG23705, mitochondrial-like n=1 Tax=Oppia nitens TaxID=1686743 RepID=UPI0023DB17BC|nr:COA8 family protein CBG23705, mitochondrial-like [Oppia nitens]